MLEILGRRNSSNVMTVMWTVGEIDLPYKRHNIGGSFGGTDSTEYLAANPNQVVPTLRDNGKTIWESNVITRYLAATYDNGGLWPEDTYQRALADQWMDWAKTTFYGAFMPIFFNMIRRPTDQCDHAAIAGGIKNTATTLSILERHLEKTDFVAGDRLTMGDIPLGPMMYRYFELDIERPSLPNVEAWYQRLCARPAFQKHAMIPFGRSFEEWGVLEKESTNIQ